MTSTVYDDPKIIQQELDEERKRIEEEHAKEKEAREDLMRNPTGTPTIGPANASILPSIESGAVGSHRGKAQKRGKGTGTFKFGGGTEEILGTIDDALVPG
jgi:transcription factor TFIIIB component B''